MDDQANKPLEPQNPSPSENQSANIISPVISPPETPTNPEPLQVSPSPSSSPAPEPVHSRSKAMIVLVVLIIMILGATAAAVLLLKPKSAPTTVTVKKDIQVLHVGTTEGPIGKDYLFPNPVSTEQSLLVDYQVFEGLVGYKNNAPAPQLATSWTNPDKTTWVFKLKPNVKFQNGKTLTAEDVKASYDALMNDDYWGQYLATVKSVTVSGPLSVTVTTNQPDSLLLGRLTQVFVFSKNTDGSVSGTGAFSFDTKNPPTDESVTLVAFDGYHQGKPTTRSVKYTIYPDTDTLEKAFLAGEIDTTDVNLSSASQKAADTKGYTFISYAEPGSYGLHLNMLKPNGSLTKKEVRQALSAAIDRIDLAKQKAAEGGTNPSVLNVPKTVVGYDATAVVPTYDVAKAKELQTKAGYPNGAPVTFLYIKGIQSTPPLIIKYLKAAGFQVTENAVDTPTKALDLAEKGDFDIIAQGYSTTTNDATEMYSGMLSSTNGDLKVYNNPEFDAMIAASEAEFNPTLHVKKVQEINRYVADNALWIPVYNGIGRVYAGPGLDGLIKNFNESSRVTYYWNTTKTVTVTNQN